MVATLPVTLRYRDRERALGGEVYVIGGEIERRRQPRPSTASTRASKTVTPFATLPHARDREAAGALGGTHLRRSAALSTASGVRTRAIYAINARSGAVHLAGLLPRRALGHDGRRGPGEIIVAGGSTAQRRAERGDLRRSR